MTPDETIEQQARREAEAKYPTPSHEEIEILAMVPGAVYEAGVRVGIAARAYAAALIAERSKPQPSVDEVMEVAKTTAKNHGAWLGTEQMEEEFTQDLRARITKLFNK